MRELGYILLLAGAIREFHSIVAGEGVATAPGPKRPASKAIPVTRLIAGTSIGTAAAIVPLSIAAIPYYARIAEVSLREVDRGLIEAVRSMGGNRWTLVREVLVPEAMPGLVSGFTVTIVTLVGASAMAGAIGAGGLGDLAIRYGYQRFETAVMVAVVAVLVVLVCVIQWAGDRLAARIDHQGG